MNRVYLEAKVVTGGWYHLYLVLRPEPTTQEEFESLSWRQSGLVIRGGIGISGNLVTQTGQLNQTNDAYQSAADIAERPVPIDITGSSNADAVWTTLKTYADNLSGLYTYNTPFQTSDPQDYIANSNATILSVLNSVGVDVRQYYSSQFLFGSAVPGGGVNATLLGSSQSSTIAASDALTSGVTILGRNGVDDFMTGTQYADRFYGEQAGLLSFDRAGPGNLHRALSGISA